MFHTQAYLMKIKAVGALTEARTGTGKRPQCRPKLRLCHRGVVWRGAPQCMFSCSDLSCSVNTLQSLMTGEIMQTYKSVNWLIHHHHLLDRPTWALAFLRNLCQLTYPAISSSDFVTRVFSRVGLSAPRLTPGYPEGPIFSVRVVSLSWLVPFLKRQDLAFCPCMT
jgi:hypothetical protein